MTADDLKSLLETIPNVEDAEVVVDGRAPRFLATVTSKSFAELDEAIRQKMVWAHLRENRPEEITEVEFIFTDAPGEDSDDDG